MAELDERVLVQAFDDLLQQTLPRIQPSGAEFTLATARRRRTLRVVLAAFVAGLAVSVPVAVYAFLQGGHGRALPIPPATPTTASPAPSTATPSEQPSVSAAPTFTTAVASPLELAEATLPLDWSVATFGTDYGCTTGAMRFYAGRHIQNAQVHQDIVAVGHSDVDGDGTPDTIALVKCWHDIYGLSQLVAFNRNGSVYATIGVVVHSGLGTGAGGTDGVGEISAFATASDGQVRVRVHDSVVCCGESLDETAGQWRVYRYQDGTFTQIEGPGTFQANSALADIRVTPKPVALGRKDASGNRHGTMTLTVVNRGPAAATGVRLVLPRNGMVVEPGGDAARCAVRVCRIGNMDAGQSVTLSIPFSLSYDLSPGQTTFGMLGLFIDDYAYGYIDIPLASG